MPATPTQPTPAIGDTDPRPPTAAQSWLDAHATPANVGIALTAVGAAVPVGARAVERRDWVTLATLVLTLLGGLLAGNVRPSHRRGGR